MTRHSVVEAANVRRADAWDELPPATNNAPRAHLGTATVAFGVTFTTAELSFLHGDSIRKKSDHRSKYDSEAHTLVGR